MTATELKGRFCELPVDSIVVADGANPRREFAEQLLFELGASMAAHSQLAPVIINRRDGHNYLVAGERRWRAAKAAGAEFVEAKVFEDLDELTAVRMAMAENRDRVSLNVIERARGLARLAELGMSDDEIAAEEHCSAATVKRLRSLLALLEAVQDLMVRESFPLPIHQAQLLLKLPGESDQLQMARKIAPVTGPVASEDLTRQWINETIGKPLPFVPPVPTAHEDHDDKPEAICSVCGQKESRIDGWADVKKRICRDCKENGWKETQNDPPDLKLTEPAEPADLPATQSGVAPTDTEPAYQIQALISISGRVGVYPKFAEIHCQESVLSVKCGDEVKTLVDDNVILTLSDCNKGKSLYAFIVKAVQDLAMAAAQEPKKTAKKTVAKKKTVKKKTVKKTAGKKD